jgi:multicomponent Na+:H+ antiporter subunit D
MALWFAGLYGYALIAVLASILTLAYFLYVQRNIFFCQPIAAVKAAEPSLTLLLPALILMTITVGLGLVFPWAIGIFVR